MRIRVREKTREGIRRTDVCMRRTLVLLCYGPSGGDVRGVECVLVARVDDCLLGR